MTVRYVFRTVSGSHLYGFASADSDRDIRGCHVLPLGNVLSLKPGPETIETVDTSGLVPVESVSHDVAKFCRLLLKSNGYALEQLYSPLIVETSPEHDQLKAIAQGCITRQGVKHWLGFSDSQRLSVEKYPRVKTVLYVYRILLAGLHMMRNGTLESNLQRLNQTAKNPVIRDLIQRKQDGLELMAVSSEYLSWFEKDFASLRRELIETAETSSLPDKPSELTQAAVNKFVVRTRVHGETYGGVFGSDEGM